MDMNQENVTVSQDTQNVLQEAQNVPQTPQEPSKQANDSAGRTIWRIIYPILIFAGVDGVVETADIFRILAKLVTNGELQRMLESMSTGMADPTAFLNVYTNMLTMVMQMMVQDAMVLLIIRCVILLPIFIVMMNKDDKRSQKKGYPIHIDLVNKDGFGVQRVLLTVVLAVATFLSFNILVSLTHVDAIDPLYKMTAQLIFDGPIVLTFIGVGIIGPILEEVLFRGIVYRRLRNRFGFVPALIVSSVIFGLIHGNLVQFIYATLVGLVLAWTYEKSNNLLIPMIIHIVANCGSTLISEVGAVSALYERLPMWGAIVVMVVGFAIIAGYYFLFNKKQVEPKTGRAAE